MNQNKVLKEYIVNLLGNTHYTWHWHVGAAPWEEKVAKILPFISSTEDKAIVVLEAVKQAPVPWSQTVADICQVVFLCPIFILVNLMMYKITLSLSSNKSWKKRHNYCTFSLGWLWYAASNSCWDKRAKISGFCEDNT